MEVAAYIVPACQVAKIETIPPGDAVDRVLRPYYVHSLSVRGIRAALQQQAAEPQGANQSQTTQCRQLTAYSDWLLSLQS
jgi:hypothetical protein